MNRRDGSVALLLSGRVFDFLKGTGFKEDLDDVFARLEAMLKRKDFVAARHLDRKIFAVNEAPQIYAERVEDINDIEPVADDAEPLWLLIEWRYGEHEPAHYFFISLCRCSHRLRVGRGLVRLPVGERPPLPGTGGASAA